MSKASEILRRLFWHCWKKEILSFSFLRLSISDKFLVESFSSFKELFKSGYIVDLLSARPLDKYASLNKKLS